MDAEEVVDLLSRLADKSLVAIDEATGRYRLLAMVRGYAEERLEERGEAAEMRERHFRWVMELAEEAQPHLEGPEMAVWLDRIETENGNLRAALLNAPHPALRLQMAGCVLRFWLVRGYLTEGRELLDKALGESDSIDPSLRAKALNGTGVLAWRKGDFQRARRAFSDCLQIRQSIEDVHGAAAALNNLGLVADDEGDTAAARIYYEQAIPIFRELGDTPRLRMALCNLAINLQEQGDDVAALAVLEECWTESREAGDFWTFASAGQNLAEIALRNGNLDRAAEISGEALEIMLELGDSAEIMQLLMLRGRIAVHRGEHESGLECLAAAETYRAREALRLRTQEEAPCEEAKATARLALPPAVYEGCWRRGGARSLIDAARLALNVRSAPG